MKKIVVTGSLVVDVTGYCSRFPITGETVVGKSLKLGAGGKGNNQATAAARLGARVVMIGKMGKDLLGRVIGDHYQKENMDMTYIAASDSYETGTALIEVDGEGDNRIIIVKDANDALTAAEVANAESQFASCDIVLTQLETSMESVLECKRLAQKYKKPIILNPAPYRQIPDGLFDGIDYLTPNETEAEYFTGLPLKTEKDAELCAKRLLGLNAANVIITMGKQGAYLHDGKKGKMIPATDLQPVDTTGAGDAFNGGLAFAVAGGLPLEAAVQFANSVASISVTRYGSAPSMPALGETLELMKRFYGVNLNM
ncbi:MAG: ribokinase [Oscillospiraceae bacterium]|nr:ribokinase [Oscillospiraceae bacterium]